MKLFHWIAKIQFKIEKKAQEIVSFSFTKTIIFANNMESSAFLLTATKAGAILCPQGYVLD